MGKNRPILFVAAAFAVYGIGLLYEIGGGDPRCCHLTWPSADPVQAEQVALKADPKGLDADFQRRTALVVLAGRPADANGWLRLAYADIKKHGRLTDEGRNAFEMSYLVQPFGGSNAAPGRLALALAVWSQLSPQTRGDALIEIRLARHDAATWQAARDAFKGSTDSSGQLTAALMGLT